MARVRSHRRLRATPQEVWGVVSDPYHLPRWWPGVDRVENVRGPDGKRRSRWTTVIRAPRSGRPVRMDFRCTSAAACERFSWEQEVEDTPFARHLRLARTEIGLDEVPDGTEVTITIETVMRGLSRLGSVMTRGPMRRRAQSALERLEEVVGP